jgi:hypothetical protein
MLNRLLSQEKLEFMELVWAAQLQVTSHQRLRLTSCLSTEVLLVCKQLLTGLEVDLCFGYLRFSHLVDCQI